MSGKLTGIGTGPGNPEMMTLQALNALKNCQCVILPGKDKEKCIAFKIAEKAFPALHEKELIFFDFPMTKNESVLREAWQHCGEKICSLTSEGKNVVFLTLGDPTVYSTYIYIHNLVQEKGVETEIINGIPSFCAAAARLGISLADQDQQIHILPGSYDVQRAFDLSGTLVFMKSGKKLGELKAFIINKKADYDFDFYAICNAGMETERLFTKPEDLNPEAGYLTLIIIKNITKKTDDGYKFFQNRQCKYFPCHKNVPESEFNCLFCYCPLYSKGQNCGGNFIIKGNGVKSCINCSFPHHKENYEALLKKLYNK